MVRALSYPVVSRVLAALLLAAAVMKLNGLAVDPVGRIVLYTQPTFQIVVIELEFLLAAWLLWGVQPLAAWATAFGIFTIFAGVSAYQGWMGGTSCGCFGRFSVGPWYALGIDLAALLALFVGRPCREARRRTPP